MAQVDSPFDPFSFEELAKHKEHRERDYEAAILIVERGIEQLRMLAPSSPQVELLLRRFQHRLRRLKHKLRGERWY